MAVRGLIVCCILTVCASASAADKQPAIVGHRGLLKHAPENTLADFKACLELRLGFELDVRRSRDGHLVCVHDATVDRTTDGTGRVTELTLAQLKQLDAGGWFDPAFRGERIPTLHEVFKLLSKYAEHDVLVAIDVKGDDPKIEGDMIALAAQHQVLEKLLFIGRTISIPEVRKRLRAADSKAHAATVANTAEEYPAALAAADADWVYVRFLPSAEMVRQVHQRGKRVFITGPTVAGELPDNWQQAAAAGLDGILTDHPLKLRIALRPVK